VTWGLSNLISGQWPAPAGDYDNLLRVTLEHVAKPDDEGEDE
jgi:hypothetical protein